MVFDTRGQAVEGVCTVCTRCSGHGGVAHAVDEAVGTAADQGDGQAGRASLTCVLLAVGVGIQPNPVAQAGQLHEARVPAQVVFAGHQGGGDGQAVAVRVAVAAVRAHVLLGEGVAGRFDELDAVVAGGEAAEQVMPGVAEAVGGGDGAGHVGAVAVVQFDGHAVQAAQGAVILLAVVVAVHPDVVAQAGGLRNRDKKACKTACWIDFLIDSHDCVSYRLMCFRILRLDTCRYIVIFL